MYGFDGLKSPLIYGSALLALKGDTSKYGVPSVKLLLDALDNYVPTPERDYTSPFILPVDNVFTVPGRGTVCVGTLKQGIIKKNMGADLLGFDEKIETNISDMQVIDKLVCTCLINNFINCMFAIRYFKKVYWKYELVRMQVSY